MNVRSQLDAVVQRLRERFPLLAQLSLQGPATGGPLEALPPYFGMISAVLEETPTQPVCLVFPRCGDAPRLAAVLHSLLRFKQRHEVFLQTLAAQQFKRGETVQLHPLDEIFVYDGPQEDDPTHFRLKELDRNQNISAGFPLWVLQMLERTARKRPKGDLGRLNAHLLRSSKAPVDHLLETKTKGNLSCIKNETLLLDSQSGFAAFLEELHLQPSVPVRNLPPVGELLPFGSVQQGDSQRPPYLNKWDGSHSGEPILAVTSSAEILANYCIDAPAAAKLVIVNGLARIRNLQAYDDIMQTQRLVLFADHDEEEMIQSLGDRGCRFWFFDEKELLASDNSGPTSGVFDCVARCARNHSNLKIDEEPCEDARIDEIYLRLDKLRGAIPPSDDGILTRLVSRAWRLFGDARSATGAPTLEECARMLAELNSFQIELQRNSAWMPSEVAAGLKDAAETIAKCYTSGSSLGIAKGAALQRGITLAIRSQSKIGVIARHESNVGAVRHWLYQRALAQNAEVFSPRSLPENQYFDHLFCVSWPGGDVVKQLAAKLVAPRITLVGYSCERRWLRQSESRFKWRPSVPNVSAGEKAAFVTGKSDVQIAWPDEAKPAQPSATPIADPEIWNFERQLRGARIGLAARPTDATETVPARYVRFAGNYYTFLTESHKLPVATELVSGRVRPNQKLPERTIAEIKTGDFVVFPESSDRELVQELADKLIGPTAPQVRKRARLWKDALQASGMTPDAFHSAARALSRSPHRATVRHWFADTSQIGPREKDDLVLIALVTDNKRLETEIEDVRLAIERLWGVHQSAGGRLRDVLLQRLPAVMGRVEEIGTQVDLDELGSAWVVQVESIAADHEPRGRSEVNRLLTEELAFNVNLLL